MSRKTFGLGAIISLVIVLGILLVPLAFQAFVPSWPIPPGSVAFDPDTDLVPEEARCDSNVFVDHSIRTVEAGNSDKRQFSAAVSIPFTGTDDAAVAVETVDEICGNPTELKMVADDMMLWPSDLDGAETNKVWIQERILDVIAKNGLESFVMKAPDGTMYVTEEFQMWAGWLNTIILSGNAEGLQEWTSVRNWEVPAVPDPTALPVAQLASVEESKPAWVRVYRDKLDNCLMVIGFNAEDRRFEVFGCEGAPPTPPSNPGCVENCGSEPPCTVNCSPPCPPGNEIPDCAPKSSNPDDYVYPEGKPPVTVNPTPDTSPPPVITEQTGGNGVVDTPTNDPGSESGVTAPDAEPAPTTPVSPPPNEGGSNDGSVGGF